MRSIRSFTPLQIQCKESMIGKRPISVPQGIDVQFKPQQIGTQVIVKGGKNQLQWTFSPDVEFKQEDGKVHVIRVTSNRHSRAQHGLARALTNNMVVGLSQGFKETLEIVGVGYRASVTGNQIIFNLGKSHQDKLNIPEGVEVQMEKNNVIHLTGYDKQTVGAFAATIKHLRKPEPYKGKGIRYRGEQIKLKQGKKGK